jgi:tRNA(adenine34) deaminase
MNKFMAKALNAAYEALDIGEIPVGAVIVQDRKVIAAAHNLKETDNDPTAHAEILVLRAASGIVGNWRLNDCDLYVTLEPCPMCASAISQSRIKRLYFGAYDPEFGGAGSFVNLINDSCEVYGGIMELECAKLLNDFFIKKR